MRVLLPALAVTVGVASLVVRASQDESKPASSVTVGNTGTARVAATTPAPEYVLLEALVQQNDVAEVERLVRNNFLPSMRADRRVLAVYSYMADSVALFPPSEETTKQKRFVVVLKIAGGTVISYSTVIDVLTKGGKTEAQVVKELKEVEMLLIKPFASKAEFRRGLSIVRTPFQP